MLLAGTPVIIRAADNFYSFIDGWRGTVTGQNNGLIEVKCLRADGLKTFYVPEAQLEAVKA